MPGEPTSTDFFRSGIPLLVRVPGRILVAEADQAKPNSIGDVIDIEPGIEQFSAKPGWTDLGATRGGIRFNRSVAEDGWQLDNNGMISSQKIISGVEVEAALADMSLSSFSKAWGQNTSRFETLKKLRENLVTNPSSEVTRTAVSSTSSSGALTNLFTNPSAEVDTTGWSPYQSVTGSTIAASTAQSRVGGSSILYTSAGTSTHEEGIQTNPRPAVTAGTTYRFQAEIYATGAARTARVLVLWFDSGGAQVGSAHQTTSTALTQNNWTRITHSGAAPTGAVAANVYFVINDMAANEIAYFDAMAMTAFNADHAYFDGSTTNLVPNPGAETDLTGMQGVGGTLSRVAALNAEYGSAHYRVTATAAGNSSVRHAAARFAVTVGRTYSVRAGFRPGPGAPTRTTNVYIDFYDSGGTRLAGGLFIGPNSEQIAGQWTEATLVNITAPTGAATAQIIAQVAGVANGEAHDIDGLQITQTPGVPPFAVPSWNGTAHASASKLTFTAATLVRDGAWAKTGSWGSLVTMQRFDAVSTGVLFGRTTVGTGGIPVTPGNYYGARVSRKNFQGNSTFQRAVIYFWKADGNATASGNASGPVDNIPDGDAGDLFVIGQAPVDAAFCSVGYIGTPQWVAGRVSQTVASMDAFALFNLGTATPPRLGSDVLDTDLPAYFDGDTAPAGATERTSWSGTAHNSASILSAVTYDTRIGGSMLPTPSIKRLAILHPIYGQSAVNDDSGYRNTVGINAVRGYMVNCAELAPGDMGLSFGKTGDQQTLGVKWRALPDPTESDVTLKFFYVLERNL